MIVHAQLA